MNTTHPNRVMAITEKIGKANVGIFALSHLLIELNDEGSDLNNPQKTKFSSSFYIDSLLQAVEILSETICQCEEQLLSLEVSQ